MYDEVIQKISDYVSSKQKFSEIAFNTARLCLADALGCAILSLQYKDCTKFLGPIVEGTIVPQGSRVPGTDYVLDPVTGAFNIGCMIRWLDFNDTWLAAEWGHPSDNIGSLLAVSEYASQKNKQLFTVGDLLEFIIKAYEIQGILALSNSFNQVGFDHVILVKIASAALSTHILGGNPERISAAISQAFIDTGPLRIYRHGQDTGSRKSWAAGDATSRGVYLAMLTMKEEMGYPRALSAKKWGFEDVILKGKHLSLDLPLECYVMENILFKVTFPAEFHGQTAVEAAMQLSEQVKDRIYEIQSIEIHTQKPAKNIIDKTGPLRNPADRDHCLQYMVAVALINGKISSDHYQDELAKDPRIDFLRQRTVVKENMKYSQDYLDPKKRSISNSVTIYFTDDSSLGPIEIEYPLGHRHRRKESEHLLFEKFTKNLSARFSKNQSQSLCQLFQNHDQLCKMSILEMIDQFC